MEDVQFSAPMPPFSTNKMYRHNGKLRYKTSEYKQWKKDFCIFVPQGIAPDSKVTVEVTFVRPNNQRADLDNMLKSVFDCCTDQRLWKDDSQIMSIKTQKEVEKGTHRIDVHIHYLV